MSSDERLIGEVGDLIATSPTLEDLRLECKNLTWGVLRTAVVQNRDRVLHKIQISNANFDEWAAETHPRHLWAKSLADHKRANAGKNRFKRSCDEALAKLKILRAEFAAVPKKSPEAIAAKKLKEEQKNARAQLLDERLLEISERLEARLDVIESLLRALS